MIRKILSKKASTLIFETVIFIILNIAFFAIMLVFVLRSGTGAVIYEQAYAKQIALLIDSGKPETFVTLDLDKKVLDIMEEHNLAKRDAFKVNESRVIVSLTGKGGYSFQYFSDYNVEIIEDNSVFLKINIKEKTKQI